MSCEHDCKKPPVFPARVFNRPALPRIGYSIGDYGRLREHLLDRLDKTVTLAAWTHRGADDPGIALLEAAAEVGDILTFYQTLYANEAFLRTAGWRESVAALVQLLGYRLAPGVGGEATFAVAVGETAIVPRGFGFKAQLAGSKEPANFESTAEVTAYPALNRFHLYRPRLGMANVTRGLSRLELHAADGRSDLASRQGVELATGDRVLLVPDTSIYDAGGGSYNAANPQKRPEVLIVQEVETVLDRVVVTFEGALAVDRATTVRAYKIDRTFRHFGHGAPRTIGQIDETDGSYSPLKTTFDRKIYGNHVPGSAVADFYSRLGKREMPLDTEVDDLAAGGKLICEGTTIFDGISSPVPFTVVKTIEDLLTDSLVWGNMTGSVTVVVVDAKLIANDAILNEEADLRKIRFHEAIGPELTLRAPSAWADGPFTDGGLVFFGTHAEALSLAQRDLLLEGEDGVQTVRVAAEAADFPLAGKDEENPWMWPITLDQYPMFQRQDFDEAEPAVTVYGNLVPADQGKTEAEAVLGSGDRRETFQTFALPKAPLTYLLDDAQSPPQVPELEVYVDGLLWQRRDTFFSADPHDRVYVVREDDEGKSYVQFGDGKTGARLPSGRGNVAALYRTGTGAAGRLEAGAKPSATGKLKPLEKVFLPVPAVGGDEAESMDNARAAAPGSLQSLGRLVSLADFEAETLALPGVVKARAHWKVLDGVPQVVITVLTASGEDAAVDKVRASLRTANRCRGPARFPLAVGEGMRQYVYLALRVGYEASRRADDVDLAVREALGLSGEEGDAVEDGAGLFRLARRQFGQDVHVSQILAAVQQAEGVAWVAADALQPLGAGGEDPAALAKPVPALLLDVLGCGPDRVLVLHTAHFDLNLSIDSAAEECS